ncbi:hypothetical protein ACP4OV_020410 [Aristida adscensionis]
MATSKKEPLNHSRDRTTRMSPNLRPSSSESSGYGYGARRVRSVPSSPDRKFESSSPSVPASDSPDVIRPSLSSAGRSTSSRTMSTSSRTMSNSVSFNHSSRTQPFPSAVSKPMLARAKSDKVRTTPQRPPALGVPPSNSFKDTSRTAAKAPPSTVQRTKLSPKPCADSCKAAASPKPIQRVGSSGFARGGRLQQGSPVHSSGVISKKRHDAANGSTISSKAKSVPQKAVVGCTCSCASRKDKEEEQEPSMMLSTPSTEENLRKEVPDPMDQKSVDLAPNASDQLEQHGKNEEEAKGQFLGQKEDAGDNELHDAGQNGSGRVKTADEYGQVEMEEAKGNADKGASLVYRTEGAQVWRKDDPKGNDVIEETKSKLLEERKSRVKALVGAFETVLSFKE